MPRNAPDQQRTLSLSFAIDNQALVGDFGRHAVIDHDALGHVVRGAAYEEWATRLLAGGTLRTPGILLGHFCCPEGGEANSSGYARAFTCLAADKENWPILLFDLHSAAVNCRYQAVSYSVSVRALDPWTLYSVVLCSTPLQAPCQASVSGLRQQCLHKARPGCCSPSFTGHSAFTHSLTHCRVPPSLTKQRRAASGKLGFFYKAKLSSLQLALRFRFTLQTCNFSAGQHQLIFPPRTHTHTQQQIFFWIILVFTMSGFIRSFFPPCSCYFHRCRWCSTL